MTVGERIQRARKARGWTQAYLAQIAKVSKNYVAKIEADTRPADTVCGRRIAAMLGLKPAEVFAPDVVTLDIAIKELVKLGGCDRAVARLREMRGAA